MNRRRGNRSNGYKQKGYNAKQKVVSIHFRYSDVVTDYAQALMLVDGRLSLLMDDCSQAELHHLEKIEFDAIMARLDTKGRQSILAMVPTVGITSTMSMTSLIDNASEAPPASSNGLCKSPLISSRSSMTSGQGSAQLPGNSVNMKSSGSFMKIQEEEEVTAGAVAGASSGTVIKMASAGNPLMSKSLKSLNGQLMTSGSLLMTPRKKSLKT